MYRSLCRTRRGMEAIGLGLSLFFIAFGVTDTTVLQRRATHKMRVRVRVRVRVSSTRGYRRKIPKTDLHLLELLLPLFKGVLERNQRLTQVNIQPSGSIFRWNTLL